VRISSYSILTGLRRANLSGSDCALAGGGRGEAFRRLTPTTYAPARSPSGPPAAGAVGHQVESKVPGRCTGGISRTVGVNDHGRSVRQEHGATLEAMRRDFPDSA
jgi:hypothetical protein